MDSDLVKMILGAALRHAAGAGGAWLLKQGIVDSDGSTQFIGAIMVIGAVLWSVWKKVGAAKVAAMLKAVTEAGAKAAPALLILIALSASAFASDVLPTLPKLKAMPNPFAGGYDITKCGAYYGINSLGTAGAVEGTNVAPGTQVVQGGIGATLGYGCPISASNQSFWFVEGLFDFTNLNGNSNGLALSGPATFVQRFGVGSPLNNMVGLIPGLASNSSSPAMPSLPTLPNGITAGPGAPYLFAAIHEQDVSAQLGLAQNRQWLISAGIGAGLRYRLSNGVVADTFAEYKLATNSICTGVLGSAGCAKIGPAAVVGVQFLY